MILLDLLLKNRDLLGLTGKEVKSIVPLFLFRKNLSNIIFGIYRFAKKPEDKNPEVLFRMNNKTHFRNLKYFFW